MVTIITEKLHRQTLEDSQFEPIRQVHTHSSTLQQWNTAFSTIDSELTTHVRLSNGARSRNPSAPSSIPVGQQRSLSYCLHNKQTGACNQCGLQTGSSHLGMLESPTTPPAPPKKRHCRSLSIPGDARSMKCWQPQPSAIWKPIPTRPHSSKHLKSCNSPHGVQKAKPTNISPILISVRHSPSVNGGGHEQNQGCANNSPGVSASSQQPLSMCNPSPGIVHFTGSDSLSFSTPSESPIPRPASASSGFYDSSQSSLNATWSEVSPPYVDRQTFKFRSLSVEEPISVGYAVNSGAVSVAGSMPVIPGSQDTQPTSPPCHRVPRCRSQPCVLHERKCGVKRRREDERPALDFFKMEKTAYFRPSGGKTVQFAGQELRSSRGFTSVLKEPPECFLGLNTIASSPLDSNKTIQNQFATALKPQNPEQVEPSATYLAVGKQQNDIDSGCDELHDMNDQYKDAGCNCNESEHCISGKNEEPLFDMELVAPELDLDQIEKD